MPVSHKYKLIMVHVPKNGGTSIQKSLEMEKKGHFPPHIYRAEYPKEWIEYTSFATIRNPIERFVSSYNYSRMENSYYHSIHDDRKHRDYDYCTENDINDIVEPIVTGKKKMWHQGWTPQYQWIVDPRTGAIDVDYLVLMDKLGEAIEVLAPGSNIKTYNKSNDVSNTLTERNIQLLSKYYEYDMDIYHKLNGNTLTKLR